jgi:hypothetical protein
MSPQSTRFLFRLILAAEALVLLALLVWVGTPATNVRAQQPTGSVPTVTGTPVGPVITVYTDQNIIGVFSGPSSYNYQQIGILMAGEKASALGYSPDGNWIEIVYYGVPGSVGWVYAPFVAISPGELPAIAAPPTATPRTTPTLDPTYVAAFGVNVEPTQLPTFTPPPAIKVATFAPVSTPASKVPFGLIILGLALIGILGAVISFLRGGR